MLGDTELIITNDYIPPASSCAGRYLPSLDHPMMTTDTLILGDFNAHHSACYSSSTDTRDTLLENMLSGFNFGIVNSDLSTKLPSNANPYSPDVCCCLPTPMTLASGGSPMFPLVVHRPASLLLRRGLSTNPGVTMWCVCGCS